MLDRVTGMQVFSRAAALGSFSAAGRSLNLSQTMVTKHIGALEERLGVKLLHRSTRRLTLTEAGRAYLQACERILAEIEEAELSASLDRFEARGVLRLNVPLTFGFREIAPALPEFARLHPDVSVELGLNDRIVDLIEEGWDLAIRIARLKDSSLVARRLAPCRTVVCAAPAYLEERGTPLELDDLRRHNCLGYTLGASIGADHWAFGARRRRGGADHRQSAGQQRRRAPGGRDGRPGPDLPADLPGRGRPAQRRPGEGSAPTRDL